MKPEGVRLHRADGTVLDVELFHQGVDDEGLDVWVVANARHRPGDRLTVETLPGRTAIEFTASVPPGTRHVRAVLKGRRKKRKR
jgi:hypothetical protein